MIIYKYIYIYIYIYFLVITTDSLLFALMTINISTFPFDILVKKEGNILTLKKLDDDPKKISYLEY